MDARLRPERTNRYEFALEQDLGRHRNVALANEVERDRPRLGPSLADGADDARELLVILLHEIGQPVTGQLVGRPTEQDARPVVDALYHVGRRFEDEHGLGDGVEDLAEAVGDLEGASILDGRARARGEIDGERDVASLERPSALGGGERDRAEDPAGHRHGRAHPGTQLQAADELDLSVAA